jgi:hypothetical protein
MTLATVAALVAVTLALLLTGRAALAFTGARTETTLGRFSLSFWLGTACAGLVGIPMRMAFGSPDLAVLAVLVAGSIAIIYKHNKQRNRPASPRRSGWIEIGAPAILLIAVLIPGVHSLAAPERNWDPMYIWHERARLFFEHPNIPGPETVALVPADLGDRDGIRATPLSLWHAEYPPLYGWTGNLVFQFMRRPDLEAVRAFHLLYYFFFLGSFFEFAGGTMMALAGALALAVAVPVRHLGTHGFADLPATGFVLAACGVHLRDMRSTGWPAAALLLAGATLTKAEGAAFSLVVLLLIGLRDGPARALRTGALPAAAFALWWIYKSEAGWPQEDFLSPTAVAAEPMLLADRSSRLLERIAALVFDPQFGLLAPVALALFLLHRPPARSPASVFALGGIYCILATFSSYYFSRLSTTFHLASSADRISLAGLSLVWLGAVRSAAPPATGAEECTP